MHTLLEKQFRPVPANEVLSSDHFPADMQQDFLICNTIGFLGIRQYDLDRGDNLPTNKLAVSDDEDYVKVEKEGQLIVVNHPALKKSKITSFKLSVAGNQQMNIFEIEVVSEVETPKNKKRNIAKTATLSLSRIQQRHVSGQPTR